MSLLAFRDVDSYYGRAQVLHGVTFDIRPEERVAILGRNGVGKTTIVNSFLGIATIRRGEVDLAGKTASRFQHFTAARSGIAVVPQGRRIVQGLTIRENLLLGAAVGRRGAWTMDRVFELFPILRERADTPGTALSGGQQQMLAIGRALMTNPKLIILDEATEGLAPLIREEIWNCLTALKAEGESILVIDKNVDALVRIADRHVVLEKGRVVWRGSSTDLRSDSAVKDRFLHF